MADVLAYTKTPSLEVDALPIRVVQVGGAVVLDMTSILRQMLRMLHF